MIERFESTETLDVEPGGEAKQSNLRNWNSCNCFYGTGDE